MTDPEVAKLAQEAAEKITASFNAGDNGPVVPVFRWIVEQVQSAIDETTTALREENTAISFAADFYAAGVRQLEEKCKDWKCAALLVDKNHADEMTALRKRVAQIANSIPDEFPDGWVLLAKELKAQLMTAAALTPPASGKVGE